MADDEHDFDDANVKVVPFEEMLEIIFHQLQKGGMPDVPPDMKKTFLGDEPGEAEFIELGYRLGILTYHLTITCKPLLLNIAMSLAAAEEHENDEPEPTIQ